MSMNRQSIHSQIESLLKIIQDQHNQIRQHQGSIPQVEIDFMIQNMRQLFEASLLLNHTNALSYLDEVKAAVTQKILAEKRTMQLKQTEEKKETEIRETVEEKASNVPEVSEIPSIVNEVVAQQSPLPPVSKPPEKIQKIKKS